MTQLLSSLGIVGLGQIGASLALAARKAKVTPHIIGFDSDTESQNYCLEKGIVDEIATPESMAQQCDLIVIAVPPAALGAIAMRIIPHMKEDTVLTDVASVKEPILRFLEENFPEGVNFIPGHPIAGGTQAGPQGANGDVFARKLVMLTPPQGVDIRDLSLERVRRFWEYLDAVIELMPAEVHDLIYGHVSHLPHLISYAASATLSEFPLPLPQPELLRRFVRIGASDPVLWCDILQHNQHYVLHALRNYIAMVDHIAGELTQGTPSTAEPDGALAAQVLFPRIAASCLIATVSMLERQSGQRMVRYSGAGFTDVASPAAEAPEGDLEQISNHARAVQAILTRYVQKLNALAAAIEGGQPKQLLTLLQEMQAAHNTIAF